MKKFLFLSNIFFTCLINSAGNPEVNDRALLQQLSSWRTNFKTLDLWKTMNVEFDTGYMKAPRELLQRWKKLGYNPNIELLEKHDACVVQQSGPTLFIHGWGDSKDSRKTRALCSSNNIPGDVIVFNFPDAARWYKKTIWYGMPITKSSFAGHSDIVTLLAVLKTLCDVQCLPAVWYPHSRGSGVTQAVVGMLNQPTETEGALLNEWDIDNSVRWSILDSIKIIYLLNPLTNFDLALNKQIQTKLAFVDHIFPQLREKCLFPLLKQYILPFLTRYDSGQKNPIDYIDQWEGLKAKVWLHFEENDGSVGNDDDVNLTRKLKAVIPAGNLFVSCVDNGGHNAFALLINQVIHEFNYINGCTHKKNIDELQRITVKNAELQEEKEIKKHLDDFSETHTQKKGFWRHRMTQRLTTAFKLLFVGLLFYYLNNSSYGICGLHFAIDKRFVSIY